MTQTRGKLVTKRVNVAGQHTSEVEFENIHATERSHLWPPARGLTVTEQGRLRRDVARYKQLIECGDNHDAEHPLARRLARIVESDVAKGWKEMADVLNVHETTLRHAYDDDPRVRRIIRKVGGRYYASVPALLQLWCDWVDRSAGSDKKSIAAQKKARGSRARFKRVT